MKLFLIGKSASITHWLEDSAKGFRAAGHDVRLGVVRRPWLNARLEAAMAEPLAARMAGSVARFDPDLILAIGGFHVPAPFLRSLGSLTRKAPIVGWVGDLFDESAREAAAHYDLVAYTDSGLLARHAALGFGGRSIFLPHAATPGPPPPPGPRAPRMVFVGTPTAGRRAVVERIDAPIAVHGPGWPTPLGAHEIHARRAPHGAVARLYAGHLAALNIRNERNVLSGLNQRSFDPCLSATPVVTDDQPDLERCFDPGAEVVVWRSAEELNAHYARLLKSPDEARRIGEAGRRRVAAEHTYGHRLAALRAAL